MCDYDIVIVGAGPAGCASAIELTNLDHRLASRILLIDKAVFPRSKLCAGGISTDTDAELQALGVQIDVSSIPVHTTHFNLPTGRLSFNLRNQFRVVRRTDFDHALLKAAQSRGVDIIEGEPVLDVLADLTHATIRTARTDYTTKVVIAADGANSTVRARLGLQRSGRLMIAMELHAPLADIKVDGFADNMAILDLRVLGHGIPGYCWIFPTLAKNDHMVSLGIMAAPFGHGDAKTVKEGFSNWLNSQGTDFKRFTVASHPSLRYEPNAASSKGRVLLVGDAAGVEPLFGEGIVCALAYGRVAGQAVCSALRNNDFSFRDYERRIRSSAIGSMMRRRRLIARRLYTRPKLARFFLKRGNLIRGLALIHAYTYGGEISWKPFPN